MVWKFATHTAYHPDITTGGIGCDAFRDRAGETAAKVVGPQVAGGVVYMETVGDVVTVEGESIAIRNNCFNALLVVELFSNRKRK